MFQSIATAYIQIRAIMNDQSNLRFCSFACCVFTLLHVALVAGISSHADVALRKPKDGNITLGAEVTLKCSTDGSTTPVIKWFKNKIM